MCPAIFYANRHTEMHLAALGCRDFVFEIDLGLKSKEAHYDICILKMYMW